MKIVLLTCVLLALCSPPAAAGDASRCLPVLPDDTAEEDFGVGIRASHTWGVIPCHITFDAVITGDDTVLGMAWDFESDGTMDAYGAEVYHTFEQAVDCQVTLEVQTVAHGTLTRTASISGYRALMSIGFDDGHVSLYRVGFPMLESKGVAGTVYIVVTWIGEPGYMQLSEIEDLQSAGWDIGSHSMTHRDLTQLDDSTLHWELAHSQAELQAEGFPAKHFACPHTAYDDDVIDAISIYYESNHVGDGLNPRVEDSDPYRLLTFTSQPWVSIATYRAHIDSVVSIGGWYILLNHMISSNCAGASWCISTQMLSDIIDYAVANRVKIATVDEALESVTDPLAGAAGWVPPGQGSPVSIVAAANGLASSGGDLRIDYGLSARTHLDIAVYDVRGRRVRPIESGALEAGEHTIWWRGENESGDAVGSGTYFIAFRRNGEVLAVRKIPVVR